MRMQHGTLTVGDVGIPIIAHSNEDMTGMNIDMKLVKPSGAVLIKDAVVSTTTATYTPVSGDIDEPGEWWIYLLNAGNPFHYSEDGPNNFWVRPTPETMARM